MELVTIIIGFLTVVCVPALTGWFAYKQNIQASKTDFVNEQLDRYSARVSSLETLVDDLRAKVIDTKNRADLDRQEVVARHNVELDMLRRDMKRVQDESNLEIATWRDRYWSLTEEHQRLKLANMALEARFSALEQMYAEMQVSIAGSPTSPLSAPVSDDKPKPIS